MSHFHSEIKSSQSRKRLQHDLAENNTSIKSHIRNIKVRSGNAKRQSEHNTHKLNIDRVLDLLNKDQLTHLLKKTMDLEPKLEAFVLEEIDCKFLNNTKFKVLQNKIITNFNKLIMQIPFERSNNSSHGDCSDTSSEADESYKIIDYSHITVNDYSFEKVKTAYLNFLNLIYDYNEYALKFGPLNMEIWSLLETSLKILISLPTLENKVNNYYKSYLIEKLDILVSDVLLQQTNSKDHEIINNIEMILNMNRSKFNFLVSSLGVEKFYNINKFINNICGTYIPAMSSTENEPSDSNGMDYINSFLQDQGTANSTMTSMNNKSFVFHDSILITGDSDDRYHNKEVNTNNGNNADAMSTDLAMGSASVYLT